MLELLAKIIPLGFASALSPLILALVVYILGAKHAKSRILAIFLGTISVAVIIIALGFLTGFNTPHGDRKTISSAITDIILGGVFIFFAVKNLISKEHKLKESGEDVEPQFAKWFAIGLLINATNFDAVFLLFTAAREIGATATISYFEKIIAALINIIFFSLPVTLPVAIYLIIPETATVALKKLNVFLLRYSKYIVFAMFAIFGVMFLYRGIHYFI